MLKWKINKVDTETYTHIMFSASKFREMNLKMMG